MKGYAKPGRKMLYDGRKAERARRRKEAAAEAEKMKHFHFHFRSRFRFCCLSWPIQLS